MTTKRQRHERYQVSELMSHRTHLQRVEQAPLADRQAGRADYAKATPEDLTIAAEHLAAGNYGYGAWLDFNQNVLGHKRRNQAAQVALWIAAIEYGCPSAFARQVYRKWTPAQQAAATAAIAEVIATAERELSERLALLVRLDKGHGIPGTGSEYWHDLKASGCAYRDANGNSKLTKHGRLELEELQRRLR